MTGNVLSAGNIVVRAPICGAGTLIEDIPNDKTMNKINTDSEKYSQENTVGY